MPDASQSRPRRIAADLRRRIESGDFRPGDLLPKERDLAEQLGVPHSTVRRAYAILREERLVEPRRQRGTVVIDPTARIRLSRAAIERDERGYYLQSGGQRHHLLTHHGIQRMPAPAEIAQHLGVEPGAEVIVRDRVLGVPRAPGERGGRPMILSTSYLPAWLADDVPQVTTTETGPGGIYDRIEETLGGPLAWSLIVTAELATAETAQELAIPRHSAVLRQLRVTELPDGRVVEVLDQRVPGDRYEIRHPLPRAKSAAWPRKR